LFLPSFLDFRPLFSMNTGFHFLAFSISVRLPTGGCPPFRVPPLNGPLRILLSSFKYSTVFLVVFSFFDLRAQKHKALMTLEENQDNRFRDDTPTPIIFFLSLPLNYSFRSFSS